VKQTVSIVITDLDNTLYDWVDLWHKSFKAMLDRLVLDSGVPEETLIQDFKKVHEQHGTSEYAFAIQELPSLQAKYPGEDLAKRFDEAIHAYRCARRNALRLYPDVLETLEVLKDKGCLLVGYTESMSFYTNRRLKKLGLDRILDYVYSPPDHEVPPDLTRYYPEEYYSLRRTTARQTPKGELKPNPKILQDIMKDVGAVAAETVYVGDNLMKDVLMAQKTGVTDIWAKYGAAQNRVEYALLRRVTHWTANDVEREKKVKAEATHTLESGFAELLDKFEFTQFRESSNARMALTVDMWKKTVDVQQHFNDLELRIRNYAVTVLAAMLGFAAYGIKENLRIVAFSHRTSMAEAVLIAAIVPWLAFYLMDRWWYHRLLYGAVQHGTAIENRWKSDIPEISLTESISRSSPFKILGRWQVRSTTKIDIFYGTVVLLFLLMGILAHFVAVPSATQPNLSTQKENAVSAPAPSSTSSPSPKPR
jgi:FMN phosphatase YigB (HAD superfamily)